MHALREWRVMGRGPDSNLIRMLLKLKHPLQCGGGGGGLGSPSGFAHVCPPTSCVARAAVGVRFIPRSG